MDFCVGDYLLASHTLPFELIPCNDVPCALLVVETRPSFFLPYVVASAVATHPGWHLYVCGTPAVHKLLERHCKNYSVATRMTLDAPPTMKSAEYSQLLMSPRLWSLIREEHVLVFQEDTVLVRPTPPAFLEFDFVGPLCGVFKDLCWFMNGGLSLRRRSAMVRATELLHAKHCALLAEPEDVAFCKVMRLHGGFTLPSMEDCYAFAIETVGDPAVAIGMHGTDKYYAPPALVDQLLALTRPQTAPAQT